MKEGKYYVGDLCYVMNDRQWSELCGKMFKDTHSGRNGKFKLEDGTELVIYGTAWGDGVYQASTGAEIAVDSGSIGAILTSDCRRKDLDLARLATTAEFPQGFEHYEQDGVIHIHNITIDTDPNEYDEDEY